MRSSDEIKNIILVKAVTDNRIRAVLLNGSRANTKVTPDALQDYDIVYIVTDMQSFITDHSWISIFGDKLIWQLPDEMTFGEEVKKTGDTFTYLVLFKDGNRIDLSLFPAEKFATGFKLDSLTVVWLDKDGLFLNIESPNDKDYLVKQPTEKEFTDTCNEFWWVCTYVSKGLLRNEITYAKDMMENPIRGMFMKIIEWYIGANTNFSVAFGKSGKNMKKHLTEKEYEAILTTYPDSKPENIRNSLFVMISLFGELARHVAAHLHFTYNMEEEENVSGYLRDQLKKSFD